MNVTEAIRQRRAVKHFDAAHVMPAGTEAELRALLRQAPTSFNIQNCRFVVLKDKALRQEVRKAAWDQAQITDASLVVVICADLKAWDRNPARYWETAPQQVRDWLVNAIGEFYRGREWQQRDEAMRSAGIAAQTLMLAAQGLGYDSCPMIGFDAEAVGKLVNLPSEHVVCMIVAVGKGAQPAREKGGFIPDGEAFIENKFAA